MIMYASWSFIFFLYMLDLALVFEKICEKETSHFIIICLFFIKMISYFLLENYVYYKYCKFVFTPWIVYGIYTIDALLGYHSKVNTTVILFKEFNVDLCLHLFLIVFFIFLLIAKITKFLLYEIFYYQKLVLHF